MSAEAAEGGAILYGAIVDAVLGLWCGCTAGWHFKKLQERKKLAVDGQQSQSTLVGPNTLRQPCASDLNGLFLRWDTMGPLENQVRTDPGFVQKLFACQPQVFSAFQAQVPGSAGPAIMFLPDKPTVAKLVEGGIDFPNHQAGVISDVALIIFIIFINVILDSGPTDLILDIVLPAGCFALGFVLGVFDSFDNVMKQCATCGNSGILSRAEGQWHPAGSLPIQARAEAAGQATNLAIAVAAPQMGTYSCAICGNMYEAQAGQVVACPSCGSHNQT